MSNIDKQGLREAAENAKIAGEAPVMPFDQRIMALNDFMMQCTPAAVMALLDELEASPVIPEELLSAMEEVLRISDRDHDAWHRARAAIAKCREVMS